MKKLASLLALCGFFGILESAKASFTLNFSSPFSGGIASGFYNTAGSTTTDGLAWGIIVDTGNNGFSGSGTAYNSYATPTVAGFLSFGGVATDDYFIPAAAFGGPGTSTTQDYSGFTEGSPGFAAGGHGTITDTSPNNIPAVNGVAQGEKFALLWLNNATMGVGSNYGFLANAGFVLPAEGPTGADYSNLFIGADAAKPANLTFTAGTVPEPGMASLSLLGFAGLFLRRRRA